MKRKQQRLAVATLAFAVLTIGGFAKGHPGSSQSPPSSVSLPFFVEDGRGHPVSAISPSDLTIIDDKKAAQEVLGVRSAKDLPLRLGILIDASKSQNSSRLYRPMLAAASDLMQQLLSGPEDKAFVMQFTSVPDSTAFMNRDALQKFKMNVNAGGGTALYDAVNLACANLRKEGANPARRVLIVLSDGEDNQSHVTSAKAIAIAQDTRTMIFAVSTGDAQAGIEMRGDTVLKKFASETGGSAFYDLGPKNIASVFAQIQAQISEMHEVTYVPIETGKAGQFRTVELRSTSDKKSRAHAPKGYYVPAAR